MASMKQIKNRKKTVESTGKITKAMKLVATVKLQKTKDAATENIPYFDSMYETVADIIKRTTLLNHKYLANANANAKKALVVISANKGLAGGYNSSIVKAITGDDAEYKFAPNDTLIYAVGSKGRDELARKHFTIIKDYSEDLDNLDLHYSTSRLITQDVLDDFEDGKIDEIYLIYTFFKNTLVHIPRIIKLLPLTEQDKMTRNEELYGKNSFVVAQSKYEEDTKMPMNYEIDDAEMLRKTIPLYITSLIHGGLIASVASENGARMTAMDSATKNAEELSDKLETQYNRARQGAITQELTEIVAGANAI